MRKLFVDRTTPDASSRNTMTPDVKSGQNSSQPLPIAEQFMRPSAMQPSMARTGQNADYQRAVQRKPVPNESDRAPLHPGYPGPASDTIRVVPKQISGLTESEPRQELSGEDNLAPNFSRLNIGNSSNNSRAHNTADQRQEVGREADAQKRDDDLRRSLEKPLPMPPATESDSDDADDAGDMRKYYDTRSTTLADTHDLERELGVEGQLDLSNTKDTEINVHWAPAVTHETIIQNVHEIEEKQITREIHQDHIYHRILPIEEVEVLPARHYVPRSDGTLREVTEQQVPGRIHKHTQKAIAHGLKKILPKADPDAGPRTFTAREFRDDEGNSRGYGLPDGSVRSERWWVHAPTVETGGAESGQTQPFHLGSSKPEDDGWRT